MSSQPRVQNSSAVWEAGGALTGRTWSPEVCGKLAVPLDERQRRKKTCDSWTRGKDPSLAPSSDGCVQERLDHGRQKADVSSRNCRLRKRREREFGGLHLPPFGNMAQPEEERAEPVITKVRLLGKLLMICFLF